MKNKYAAAFIIIILCNAFAVQTKSPFLSPAHFPKPLVSKKLDTNAIALGRLLFYDPILSADSSVSCASCHSPYNAFAHTDHALSHGIFDSIGTRNAPALFNLAWQNTFMWDGSIHSLTKQAIVPISSKIEMGESLESIRIKLKRSVFYPELFYKNYKNKKISNKQILNALAQFQLSLISANSKYDEVKNQEDSFSIIEQKGYQLFLKNCYSCHQEPLFSNYQLNQNFIDIDPNLNNYGHFLSSKNPNDSFKFKTPSLRNLSYSYPYMHDGRFNTLNEVLNHYTHPKTQKEFSEHGKNPVHLSSNEKVELIAFLLTLNDKAFVFNKKHQFPKELLILSKDAK